MIKTDSKEKEIIIKRILSTELYQDFLKDFKMNKPNQSFFITYSGGITEFDSLFIPLTWSSPVFGKITLPD